MTGLVPRPLKAFHRIARLRRLVSYWQTYVGLAAIVAVFLGSHFALAGARPASKTDDNSPISIVASSDPALERHLTPEPASRGGLRPANDAFEPRSAPTEPAPVADKASPDSSITGEAATVPTRTPPTPASTPQSGPVAASIPSEEVGKATSTVQVLLNVDPNLDHWRFIQSAVPPAQASQRETGVPASATIAQAIHESDWGRSRLSREAFNYFGIKATRKPGTKGVMSVATGEHINGQNITVKDAFRAYGNMEESFIDHGRFFFEDKRYALANASLGDSRTFVQLIAQAGYATDPNYAKKVLAYMEKYNLFQYDLD